MSDFMVEFIQTTRGASHMSEKQPQKYGLFLGVFTPSMLTILGTIMYLRFGWVVGNAGLFEALMIVTMANVLLITALSVSSLATSQRVGVGGAYFLISRSLGIEIGGAIGLPLYLSQTVSLTLYCFGLAKTISMMFGWTSGAGKYGFGDCVYYSHYIQRAQKHSCGFEDTGIDFDLCWHLNCLLIGADWSAPIVVENGNYLSEDVDGLAGICCVFSCGYRYFDRIVIVWRSSEIEKDIPYGTFGCGFGRFHTVHGHTIGFSTSCRPCWLERQSIDLDGSSLGRQWLIWPGLLTAIISSAIGSIFSSSKTLQAMADDGVLPNLSVKQQMVSPNWHWRCIFLGWLQSLLFSGGPKRGSHCCYTFNNIWNDQYCQCFRNHRRESKFSPSIQISWQMSLIAALGCFGVMFLINPMVSVLAFALEIIIYFVLSRRALTTTWGDMRAGAMMALTRWSLLRQRQLEKHARRLETAHLNLLLNVKKDLKEIRLASSFSQGRGITTVCSLKIEI